jgi:proline iminopeptidase
MEAHYFVNDCFMKPDQLLDEAARLKGIPGIIVQGRFDLLCPPSTSHALAARWREAEIRIVEDAGHSLYDPGIRNAVMKAIADIASKDMASKGLASKTIGDRHEPGPSS